MTREEAIEIFKRLKENAPNEMHLETVGSAQELFEMAIQALSQEPCRVKNELNVELNELKPCTDVVSRQAIIYYIKGHIHEIITESGTDKNAHTNSILRALINGVETMPSVTHKSGKWIPVSERLPEEGEEVLISGYDTYNKRVIISRYQGEQYGFTCGLVSAWMPLPKPFEPQESEDKE